MLYHVIRNLPAVEGPIAFMFRVGVSSILKTEAVVLCRASVNLCRIIRRHSRKDSGLYIASQPSDFFFGSIKFW